VRRALYQRQQWLVDQELMECQGTDILYRNNLLSVLLRRRELQASEISFRRRSVCPFAETIPGVRC